MVSYLNLRARDLAKVFIVRREIERGLYPLISRGNSGLKSTRRRKAVGSDLIQVDSGRNDLNVGKREF